MAILKNTFCFKFRFSANLSKLTYDPELFSIMYEAGALNANQNGQIFVI